MLLADAPDAALDTDAVMARARAENFPVASRIMPRHARAHLLAVYGFARLVDELGDAASGDRLAALDAVERELDRAFAGAAEHPLLARLQPTLRACALSREPFARLIEANRMDQRVARYESWEQLRGYCELSANPVGEIVLGVLGNATAERVALSDSICTALQLTEHLQDVAEDVAAGRFYVPAHDLERFGASHTDLERAIVRGGAGASEQTRSRVAQALEFEAARARSLLEDGAPLIGTLAPRARIAVAAFVAGGNAALDALERARFDVSSPSPRAPKRTRALALAAALLVSGRRRRGDAGLA
jgi:squalene synthase HpnC